MATGRLDAFFFAIGGLIGAAAYMLSYAAVKATGLLDGIFGGKATLGELTTSSKFPALFSGVNGEILGLCLGAALIVVAWLLPDRHDRKAATSTCGVGPFSTLENCTSRHSPGCPMQSYANAANSSSIAVI